MSPQIDIDIDDGVSAASCQRQHCGDTQQPQTVHLTDPPNNPASKYFWNAKKIPNGTSADTNTAVLMMSIPEPN